MSRSLLPLSLSFASVLTLLITGPRVNAADGIRPVLVNDSTSTASGVVVDGSKHLAYTSLILPLDAQARDIAPGDFELQAKGLFDILEATLNPVGSGLERLVKLNVYLAKAEDLGRFRSALARRMAGKGTPAVSYVVTSLPRPRVLVGLDAVAVSTKEPSKPGVVDRINLTDLTVQRPGNHIAILPAGARIFISGQADPGSTLAEATRKTLEGLELTLNHLGLTRRHIVQAKSFLQPMASVGDVESEFLDFFGPVAIPPLTFVEWKSSASQPIEIELVVAAGPRADGEVIEYLAPPQLKPSPVFSRIARVNGGDLVYISGLYGEAAGNGEQQVRSIFDLLGKVLKETGSDFRHLAKATYYVSDEEASRALNDLRPRYYDPARPPAASKAMITGVGVKGRSVTLDLIAVPAGKAQ